MTLTEIMQTIDGFIWGTPFLAALVGAGILFFLVSKGFVFPCDEEYAWHGSESRWPEE